MDYQEVQLTVLVGFCIQEPDPHKDMRLGGQGRQRSQNLLFTIEVRRNASGIGMEDGHTAPGQGWFMVNEFLQEGTILASDVGQMVR